MGEENQVAEIKAFDLEDLKQILKAKGLPDIENLAKHVFEGVCEWAEKGVKASPSNMDDFALAVLPPFKAFVIGKLDGISK